MVKEICDECNSGELVDVTGPGRFTYGKDGSLVAIPDELVIPTCNKCEARLYDSDILEVLGMAETKKYSGYNCFGAPIAELLFGREANGSCCVTCGSTNIEAEDFRDEVSVKEFFISFMCQKCQDDVFTEEENDEQFE